MMPLSLLTKTLGQQLGLMTSALEHRVPELFFTNEQTPGEAVSAVKALALASAQGQRLYQVTVANVNTVLPVLSISQEVKDEIRNSVAVGKVVTVSQNNVTVGGWTGVGYIVSDPPTGSGAYRISGGMNGGLLDAGETSLIGLVIILGLLPYLGMTLLVYGPLITVVFTYYLIGLAWLVGSASFAFSSAYADEQTITRGIGYCFMASSLGGLVSNPAAAILVGLLVAISLVILDVYWISKLSEVDRLRKRVLVGVTWEIENVIF